ncbi:MAG: hypothetical protein LBL59_08775 [Xanthomonadaceae bacterium]|jgi:hypothetical protein|nr:hypothetical protein [Xanthomonadaceae bacterium]
MLLAANEAGQLKSVTFMLQDGQGRTMVDYRGSLELTELSARTISERIAAAVEKEHPAIAAAQDSRTPGIH